MCGFLFFKQKTAYEMRISDWSSDVCSSDLGSKQFADYLVGIRGIPLGHLVDGGCEQAAAGEDVGILGEKAEDEARHEMVHVRAAVGGAPIGVGAQQLDIELVQAARRLDVERVFTKDRKSKRLNSSH